MKSKYFLYIFFLLPLMISGCNEDDPNVKKTNAVDFAGEWWVTYSVKNTDGSLEDVGGGYSKVLTSNTAANTASEIILTDVTGDQTRDHGNFWTYKVKVPSSLPSLSFVAPEAASLATYDFDPYPIKLHVLNGKIIKDGGFSKTKVKVDSIYFEVEFEDDTPAFGTTYIVSGHKRTGFYEDEF